MKKFASKLGKAVLTAFFILTVLALPGCQDPANAVTTNGPGGDAYVGDIGIGNPSVNLYLSGSLLVGGERTIISQGTGLYTVSIDDGTYLEIIWFVNGVEVSRGTTNTSISLSSQLLRLVHVIVEAVLSGGSKNTGSHYFEVQ